MTRDSASAKSPMRVSRLFIPGNALRTVHNHWPGLFWQLFVGLLAGMYSAYQAGQLGSACSLPLSCCRCASAARIIAWARSADRGIGRVAGDARRKPLRNLLQHPAVAVRIAE